MDQSWNPGDGPGMEEASWRVGRRQLNRLRPLRDLRVVQKYLSALDAGTVRGWHPMVFGVVLAAFGIPLRQGLVHYATQTATGWCDAVLRIREWPREEGELAVERVCAPLSRCMPPLPNSELFAGRNLAPGA
jgi:urease accessory protein UreF